MSKSSLESKRKNTFFIQVKDNKRREKYALISMNLLVKEDFQTV